MTSFTRTRIIIYDGRAFRTLNVIDEYQGSVISDIIAKI